MLTEQTENAFVKRRIIIMLTIQTAKGLRETPRNNNGDSTDSADSTQNFII